jgi:hypothetical protein
MKKTHLAVLFVVLSAVCYSQRNSVLINSPQPSIGKKLFNTQSDSFSGRWNYIAPLQKPLFGVASYYWSQNDKVFICGGADSLGLPVPFCYFYNITTNSYEPRDTLFLSRLLGKLVRVKDSLYLVGSVGPNFNVPDGALYKYDPALNKWSIKAPAISPAVHEMAVCVWKDSLIITVGGSTNGFGGTTNIVRVYNPSTNVWSILSGATNIFPVNITTAQAECIGNNIILVGGSNNSQIYNMVYRGYIYHGYLDSLFWLEDSTYRPFGSGVYRLGSAHFGNYVVFGPGLGSLNCINQVWGFNVEDSTWASFMPNSNDIAGNRSLAIKTTSDSLFLYTFGGITRDSLVHFINRCEQYSTGNPYIGITGNENIIPDGFILYQNYPNPFNPSTKIKFSVPSVGQSHVFDEVKLKVYDIRGREIAILIDKQLKPGTYETEWNGSKYSSGIYFYFLQAGDFFEAGKMVLIK